MWKTPTGPRRPRIIGSYQVLKERKQCCGILPSMKFPCSRLRSIGLLICRKQDTPANNQNYLASKLEMEHADTTCEPGSEIRFRVRIENVGSTKWSAFGNPGTKQSAIQLGTHLVGGDEAVAIWEYGRVTLKSDLAPGKYQLLEVSLRTPNQPGRYFVEFDMVAEQLSWFEDLGPAIVRQEINVV
jgi:hypothetical protein